MKFPEQFRWKDAPNGYHSFEGEPFGCFRVSARAANGRQLDCIVANGEQTGWEHVSVTLLGQPKKAPSWAEMCIVKALFWGDDETVIEFHPPKSDYVNVHEGCLHLWKCVNQPFPLPPKICV